MFDALDCNLVIAHLVGDDTQQVPGSGVLRLDGENLPVELLRGRQSAGLVMPDGTGKRFLNHGNIVLGAVPYCKRFTR
jgi:hypothetical protein